MVATWGDFNNKNNSYLQFTCVDIPEEGPYELKIFTNDPTGRPLDIQINNYAKTYINVNKSEGKWDQLPTAETSVLVWLDKRAEYDFVHRILSLQRA